MINCSQKDDFILQCERYKGIRDQYGYNEPRVHSASLLSDAAISLNRRTGGSGAGWVENKHTEQFKGDKTTSLKSCSDQGNWTEPPNVSRVKVKA